MAANPLEEGAARAAMPSVVTISTKQDKDGSSGYGMSYWLPFLDCPRKAYLKRQLGLSPSMFDQDTGERKTNRYGKPKLNQALVGLILHKILEHYHTGTLPEIEFVYDDVNSDLEFQEALRIYREYQRVVKPDQFGKFEAVEEFFRVGSTEEEHIPERLLATELFGIPIFTGRRDGRALVETEEQAAWYLSLGAPVQVGDRILIDHKTHTRHDTTLMGQKLESLQFHAYLMAARALGEDLKGCLANTLVCTKEPEFLQIWVPFPTTEQQLAVKDVLSMAFDMRARYGEAFANPTRCFDYFLECPFLNRQCDRTNALDLTKLPR